ncbi:hypothetical protein [Agaribacter flavus]|uniref:Uncharacterized protein n=1 Tax=Agaribacter flavus TaxID=1902781 RepID=A0ABV7FLM5_9ALTE
MNQNEKIERYILNKMSEEEASEFEAYYLSNEACIEQLELSERLYRGIKLITPELDREDELLGSKRANTSQAFWQKNVPVWSIAAMFMLLLLPNVWYLSKMDGSYQDIQVVNIDLSSVRGTTSDVIDIYRTNKQTVLATYIDREAPHLQFEQYGFSLTPIGKQVPEIQVLDAEISPDDMLYINLKGVAPENYSLKIFGLSESSDKALIKETQINLIQQKEG